MIAANSLRNGTVFTWEDHPWKVLKFEHMFKGRGRGKITVRVRNLIDRSVREISFQSSDSVEEADLVKKKLVFLYRTREDLVFRDLHGELAIPLSSGEWDANFLTKSQEIWVLFYEGKPIGIQLPPTVVLSVKRTDPGVRGDTVSNTLKSATLSTGLSVKVPLFISEGENIVVSTETGEYRGRA